MQGHYLSGELVLTVEKRVGGKTGVFFKISARTCKAPGAYSALHIFRELSSICGLVLFKMNAWVLFTMPISPRLLPPPKDPPWHCAAHPLTDYKSLRPANSLLARGLTQL